MSLSLCCRKTIGAVQKYIVAERIMKMGKYFQEEIETASREQITQWHEDGLKDVVKRVYENVPFYRKKMEEAGVTPDDIQSLDDIVKLPFLTKDDLRDAYPYGLLALPLSECVRIFTHRRIWITGQTAAQEPLSQRAEIKMTSAMSAMDTVFSPAARD